MFSIKFDDTYLNKNQISQCKACQNKGEVLWLQGSETDIFQKERGCLETRKEGAEKASWKDRIPVERK